MKKKVILLVAIACLIGVGAFLFFYLGADISIQNVTLLSNGNIEITSDSDSYFCYVGDSLDESAWVESDGEKCTIPYQEEHKYIYLKGAFRKVKKVLNTYELGMVNDLTVSRSKIYLAVGATKQVVYDYDTIGNVSDKVTFTSANDAIATVDDQGVITGVSNGNAKITVSFQKFKKEIDVLVTDEIIPMPDTYNFKKPYVPCGRYTKEENDLLDEILKDRIEEAGYLTRAGVVAAGRFLMLEFPYRLRYFSENGRMYTSGTKVDGEGRYYHTGLYLDESRREGITHPMHGPAEWGCEIYSIPSAGMRPNGFDCSGFISWIIHQAGYDNQDLGAGVSYGVLDMTDLGEKHAIHEEDYTMRVGDLLSGDLAEGGHIAMLVGLKDGYYYVAESLWYIGQQNGPLINKYDFASLKKNFYWVMDMDEYYKEDGNYTEFWTD